MPALFVKHLTVMDFSYVDIDRGILGESWIVDVVLHGELDHQGMVFDFGHVKKQIKQAVDGLFDHKLLVPTGLPSLTTKGCDDLLQVSWKDALGRKFQHISPTCSVALLHCETITTENVCPLLEAALKKILPSNVTDININLRQELIEGPQYQYSHGLKKHDGNCQRIAHGHRSRIDVFRAGKRDHELEAQWAQRWHDIYLGTREDLLKSYDEDGTPYFSFGYDAPQGRFELTLPAACCELIDTDSTVEYLADFIAHTLKQQCPEDDIEVFAYEGVLKGAMACR